VGKNKLERWAEMATFNNVIQHADEAGYGKNHPVKGKWRTSVFKNPDPLILELGCGRGEYTISLASRFPEKNYVGVDIKGARMWRGAKSARDLNLQNAFFLRTRIEFINSFFDENEVDEIWLTFPDPQNEKRNSNKRLTCPWFLNAYRNILKDNGVVHLKTDNSELFRYTLNLAQYNRLHILEATDDLHNHLPDNDILRIRTHYEDKFLREGLKINYIAFALRKNIIITDAAAEE